MSKIFQWTQILSVGLSIAAASFPMRCLAQDPPDKQQNGNPDRKPNGAGRGQQGAQQGGQRGGPKGGGGSGLGGYEKPPSPANDVPTRPFDLVLGRPTDVSITLRVMPFENGQGRICYGVEKNKPDASDTSKRQTTVWTKFQKDVPLTIELTGLSPNTRYSYTWEYQADGASKSIETPLYFFHTQRATGSSYVFTVTSDSHLDENSSGDVYLRTLANVLADQSDFHLELGDTFMTGKYKQPQFSYGHYLSQRYYLGSACHSVPFYLVLGNHDGESPARGDTIWATKTRKALFPNPSPNAFYSGNPDELGPLGTLDDYYAWRWGDALFIALDPYRYTLERPRRGENNEKGNWFWTLGEKQYHWLQKTLKESSAKYKFVFIHHLVGGADQNNRGGAEAAPFWEWGGKSADGKVEFSKYRPGWDKPIHQLLVDHGVQIVFHGHDHIFAKQDLDGIVYQEVPQPSHSRIGNTRTAAEYGYLSGEIQPSSGHLRIRVAPDQSRVDYVRSYLPKDEDARRRNGEVSYTYEVHPK
ncbi:MAG: metallophosphoesterase family protein [Planctomycetota bacterium]